MSKAALQTDLLQAVQSALPDDALREVRSAAVLSLLETGLPTTRHEDWKYTNLADATNLSNEWLRTIVETGANVATTGSAVVELPEIDCHRLLLADGLVDEVALYRVSQAVGDSLSIARLRDRAGSIATDGPLDTFNAALLQDGLHVEMPAGQKLEKPLSIVVTDAGHAVSQSRVVVEVGEGAQLDLVEYHLGGVASAHFANSVTQLRLAAGATVNFLRIQDRDRDQVQVGKLTASLDRDATLNYSSFDLGGALVRQDVVADLAAPGALVTLYGLYLAGGEQHIDNHTRVDHRVGPAASREEFRGILNGKSRCVFNGKAIVHEGADGSDAEQANHNLLLSDKAEIDTKPELEIYADDVKCSHGATVGQLDDTALFYMQSRGLDRDEARHMLTRSFAARILQQLSVPSLREHLEQRVDRRLDELLEDREQ